MAVAVSLVFSSPRVRVVFIAFFAMLISYIVIVTGNHYWIDGVVGWMFIGSAIVINHFIPFPLVARAMGDRREQPAADGVPVARQQGD